VVIGSPERSKDRAHLAQRLRARLLDRRERLLRLLGMLVEQM
jgi:hypothetical protein